MNDVVLSRDGKADEATTVLRADVVFVHADPAAILPLVSVLSPEELNRASQYRHIADQHRFIVGRAALRGLLSRYLCADPSSFKFMYGSTGKPRLASGELHFNVAHSGDIVALAFASGEVGVDVEKEIPVDAVGISQGILAKPEFDRLQCASDRLSTFFRIWTAKEAVVKAIARGISMPLERFAVPQSRGLHPIELLEPDSSLSGWCVAQIKAKSGYAAAVSLHGNRWRVVTRWETAQALL